MKKIKFSIIIPVYNEKLEYFKKAIDSIVNQIDDSYEIIVIDDGSKEKEIEFYIKNLKNENIKYIYQENQGSAAARNNGIKNSNGEYIIFVDSDDMIEKNFFNNLKSVDYENYDVIFFRYFCLLSNNELEEHYITSGENMNFDYNRILEDILYAPIGYDNYSFGALWGKLYKRSFIVENEIKFKDDLRKAQDRAFLLNLFLKKPNIKYYDKYMYVYRKENNNSITHKLNFKMIDYYERLYKYMIEITKNLEDKSVLKFLEYGMVHELLTMTVFHSKNQSNLLEKRKLFFEIYDFYNLKEKLVNIKYNEINSRKGKIKLFLYKHKFFILLYIFL